jgi:hypothetical protein
LTFFSPNKQTNTYTLSSKASFGAIDKKNEKRERERRDPPARAFLFLSKKKKKKKKKNAKERERLGDWDSIKIRYGKKKKCTVRRGRTKDDAKKSSRWSL